MTITTCLGDYYCPQCGILGQLKFRSAIKGIRGCRFEIDHYKGRKGLRKRLPLRRGSKYAYSCYLGKVVVTWSYDILYPQPTLFAVQLWRHFF